jgi:hypothetical protein
VISVVRRWYSIAALVAVLAIAVAIVWGRSGGSGRAPTPAQLADTNYRTLTRQESARLLRFARNEHACLSARRVPVSAPVASPTRITMTARGQGASALASATIACGPQVGPPPQKSSLQARPNAILLYLPKRCLMNPHDLSGS